MSRKRNSKIQLPRWHQSDVDEQAIKVFLRLRYWDDGSVALPPQHPMNVTDSEEYRTRLVHQWATTLLRRSRRMVKRGGRRAEFSDAFQSAALAIWRADEAHRDEDPELGGTAARAHEYLRVAQEELIADLHPLTLGGKIQRRLRRYKKFVKAFTDEHDYPPSYDDIAKALGLSRFQGHADRQIDELRMLSTYASSFEQQIATERDPDGDDDHGPLGDQITDAVYAELGWQTSPSAEDVAILNQQRNRLAILLPRLTERERDVVLADERFDAETARNWKPKPVSRQYVNQIRQKAIAKLRRIAAAKGWVSNAQSAAGATTERRTA
jgi:hypothetical protein